MIKVGGAMPLFTPVGVKDDLQPSPAKPKRMKIDHPVAERTFMLFRRDGTSLPVTVRLGAPFVGKAPKPPTQPEYRCAIQILGIGDERVTAPWGEDPFVALQYAIDFVGEKLDDFVRRENLEIRFRTGKDQQKWIWRYPPY
jgi:hypothetical protein